MAGIPGPPPKKDAERRRRNKTPDDGSLSSIPAQVINLDETLAGETTVREGDAAWHDIAKAIYEDAQSSGQALFWEPSDWAVLYLACESISRDLSEQVVGITESGDVVRAEIPLKGASLNAYNKVFSDLMLTEGSRRKVRLELERQKRLDAVAGGDNVVDIHKKRADAV